MTVGTPAALATPTVMKALASQREPPGRQVGADARHRDVAGAREQAGDQLGLEVGEVRALRGGEGLGALGAELDRLAQVGGEAVAARRDLGAVSSMSPPW